MDCTGPADDVLSICPDTTKATAFDEPSLQSDPVTNMPDRLIASPPTAAVASLEAGSPLPLSVSQHTKVSLEGPVVTHVGIDNTLIVLYWTSRE